jgi:hypothetical protein
LAQNKIFTSIDSACSQDHAWGISGLMIKNSRNYRQKPEKRNAL